MVPLLKQADCLGRGDDYNQSFIHFLQGFDRMKHEISKHSVYITGAARFDYLVYLVIKDRALLDEETEHSRFIGFQHGQLGHMGDENWNAAAMCIAKKPSEKLIVLGEGGEVFTYVKGVSETERIKPKPAALRGLAVIDGLPFACGMKRQVFKRTAENTWIKMHAPAAKNTGFEAIAGFSEEELYVAGWGGEIWRWEDGQWQPCPSPTTEILTSVSCGEDKKVYVCGRQGTLLIGRRDKWRRVNLDFSDDLWSSLWFEGALWLATHQSIYTFAKGKLKPVKFGKDKPGTCGMLTAAQGVLWSIGAEDVFSFDGKKWTRVD
jgi:hypothetical protein